MWFVPQQNGKTKKKILVVTAFDELVFMCIRDTPRGFINISGEIFYGLS